MAKVSLRIYNREIEGMIDQGRTEEAIAHCHHILKTFPKHLETYRLLGKSYLESKRYGEAVDIFGRVLMSVPDDFVAHVGMSIIHDEENKSDDAIWHMERAFEAKSANAAIQGELQRLYGRRDGMEPPKIRMTRGALAHMYVQGELYPQAIAEIRAVLAQDPQRGDMQVLLAYSYFKAGQKSDASDMCAQLLKRYPYSFDANRIMVELSPATSGAAEMAQVYRTRVGELDPYSTYAKGSVFQSNEVADAAINLDRLEYTGSEVPMGQEWSKSLGIGLGASSVPELSASLSDEQPDWLKSGGFSDTQYQTSSEPVSASQSNDEIPDFLREAGWAESNSLEQPTSIFDVEPGAGNLAPAEMPDWLKGQMPVASSQLSSDSAQSIETPDWLKRLNDAPSAGSLDSFQAESGKTSDAPDWLSGLDSSQSSEPLPPSSAPDWLSGLGDNSQTSNSEQPMDSPDWLSGLGGSQVSNEPAQPVNAPDWLRGLADPAPSEASASENVPDWLSGLEGDSKGIEPAQPANVPDWLNSLDTTDQPAQPVSASVQDLGASAQEQDDAVAWLESLASKHGAKPEEMVTDPNKRSETPPEWVSQAQNLNQQEPAAQAPSPSVESLGSTAQEQDDAVAWLESLAVKHGAKPEELVTDPGKRFETPPEWVSQAQTIGEAQAATDALEKESQKPEAVENALNIGEQFFAEFEDSSTAEPARNASDETGLWLRNLEQKEKEEEYSATKSDDLPDWSGAAQTQAEQTENQKVHRDDKPAWLSNAQTPADLSEPKPAERNSDLPNWMGGIEDESAVQNSFNDQSLSGNDLSNWLSGLDDEPGLPFDALPTPDSILAAKTAQDITSNTSQKAINQEPGSDLPDWLSGVEAQQESQEEDLWKKSFGQEPVPAASVRTEASPPVNQAGDLPDWLQGVDKKTESIEEIEAGEDAAPWLHREKWEAEGVEQPKPTSPSDWHPITENADQKQSFVQPPTQTRMEVEKNAPEMSVHSALKKKPSLAAKPRQPEAQGGSAVLNQAKGELDRGDIPAALDHYGKLIKKGKQLDETIRDLTDSLYRYPVEVSIWQTLGDAYMRANRLKEALESYNKAEELIR